MIDHSFWSYVFIRVCVVGLHAVAPLSVLYTICDNPAIPRGAIIPTSWRLPLPVRLWLAAEALFYVGFQVPYRVYLQNAAIHPPLRSKEQRRELFDHVLDNVSDAEAYVTGWFKGAKYEDIGRETMKSFLAWAFFEDRIGPEEVDELEGYTREVESMLGRPLQPGEGKAKPLRLTIDHVDIYRRSLVWYLCIGITDAMTFVKLSRSGFHFHRLGLGSFFLLFPFRPIALTSTKLSPAKHTTYWHRPHTSKKRLPMLFIHGIGIGLYPYTNFMDDLNAHVDDGEDDGQVGIIAVEIMPISTRLTHAMLDKDVLCDEIQSILAKHQYDNFVLISHSYGSVITTHLLHNAAMEPKISSVLLIDPVSFLLHKPDVAYNFTVREPQLANEYQLSFFASKDPGVAHTLGRRFFWSENVLWLEDLMPRIRNGLRVTVSLSGRDLIVDTESVGRYLTKGEVHDHKLVKMNGNGFVKVKRDDLHGHEVVHINGNGLVKVNKGGVHEDEEVHMNGNGLRDVTNGVLHDSHHANMNGNGYTKKEKACEEEDESCKWKHKPWKGEGLEVIWFDDIDHAQCFDTKTRRARLVKVVRRYCEGE